MPTWQHAVILVYATLALVVDYYHHFPPLRSGILYLVIPLAMMIIFRFPLRAYGVQIGDWRRGLLLTLGGWILTAPILWFATRGADFTAYYQHLWERGGLGGTLLWAMADLISWEFFFRGCLLFILADIAGNWAILLQAMVFTLGHLSKPELEVLSCIAGGSAFGWVAWETRSFLYPFAIHLFVTVFTVWVAAG